MFILPHVMVLLLVLTIALLWCVIRLRRRFIVAFVALALVCGVLLWHFWLHDVTYTVGHYVNDVLTGSYEEDYRTWYKVFVTGELATIVSGVAVVVASAASRRIQKDPSGVSRPRT